MKRSHTYRQKALRIPSFSMMYFIFTMTIFGNVLFSHYAIAQDKLGEIPKIAYVDYVALRNGYTAMLQAQQTNKGEWDKASIKHQSEIDKKSEALPKQAEQTSEIAKAKEVEEELHVLKNAYKAKLQELREQQGAQMQQFETDIQASISEVVAAGQYVELRTLFKNTQACDGVDITPLVLKKLNK